MNRFNFYILIAASFVTAATCSNYCNYATKCYGYRYKSCGLFGWQRCRYRYSYTCYPRVCCKGWTDLTNGCNKPICNTPCDNGGTCIQPDTCKCLSSYSGKYCQTYTEPSTTPITDTDSSTARVTDSERSPAHVTDSERSPAHVTDTEASTTPVTVFSTTSDATATNGCSINGACTQHDFMTMRLKPLFGSGCKQFCQCAYGEGSAGTAFTYVWKGHSCPVGTLFDDSLPTPVCNHEFLVYCEDTGTEAVP